MGGAKNCPETPRQRMIGMMYLVLTAMLALNVSTNVLDAFGLVDKSLHTTLAATVEQNENMYNRFESQLKQNPEKTQKWYEMALEVKAQSDSLYDFIQNFKIDIAILVDGSDADSTGMHIVHSSDFDKTGQYALVQTNAQGVPNGEALRQKIEHYRAFLEEKVAESFDKYDEQGNLIRRGDTVRSYYRNKRTIDEMFSTSKGVNADGDSISWEASVFDGMPVGASMAILTKFQNDVRTYEGKMVGDLYRRIDAGDLRVNKLNAYVIPESQYVMRGSHYRARIVLAAVDSTATPSYFVEGDSLGADGIYDVVATGSGVRTFSGKIVYKEHREYKELPFQDAYTVGEPSATISNLDMCVIYSGYANKYSVSVPGVADENVRLTASGANVSRSGKTWIVTPTVGPGKKVTLTAFAEVDGHRQSMGAQEYTVRKMPTPSLFFVASNGQRYDFSRPVPKRVLVDPSSRFEVGYDESEVLKVNFELLSFSSKARRKGLASKGSALSSGQIAQFKKLESGDIIQIMNIEAKNATGAKILARPVSIELN